MAPTEAPAATVQVLVRIDKTRCHQTSRSIDYLNLNSDSFDSCTIDTPYPGNLFSEYEHNGVPR